MVSRRPDAPRIGTLPAVFCLSLSAALFAPEKAWTQDPKQNHGELARAIETVMARPEFATSTFGIFIARLHDGRVLYEHGADRLLPPASTTKLVSGAGALLTLGADHRLRTRVVTDGSLKDGKLDGDLVLVASGDPNLSQRMTRDGKRLQFENSDHSYAGLSGAGVVPGDPLRILDRLAEQVHAAGIRTVVGDVVVDDGLFQDRTDSFVGPFSAMCVNDNLLDVWVSPGDSPGSPASVRWQPEAEFLKVIHRVKTGEADSGTLVWLERSPEFASYTVRGSIAATARETLRTIQHSEPARVAAGYFAEALARAGVTVDGEFRATQGKTKAGIERKEIAAHTSAPFSEALKIVLKTSQNLHATMLPPLISAERGGKGTRVDGYRRVATAFKELGIDPDAVVIGSGSGGGRADYVSARWLVSLLRAMARREDFPAFLAALPVGGVDGTLAKHFRSSELVGRVRAKTGTLLYRGSLNSNWVFVSKALAGYADLDERLTLPPEKRIVFAILISGTKAPKRRAGVDALFRAQEDIVRAALGAARSLDDT